MSDDPLHGVVNDRGEVYDGTEGGLAGKNGQAAVHEGLYVTDGSVVPGSLIANPFYTIGAISERVAAGITTNPRLRDLFV